MTAETERIIARFEAAVIVHLAGKAAARRALLGSAPGWQRWRTPEELLAHHEAGHAIAQWARGDFVWKLSIMGDKSVQVGNLGYLAGFSSAGVTPAPPGPIEFPARVDCDLRNAASDCMMLSLCEPPYGWRGAVRVAHRLRARTRDLVDQHWHLIAALAGELVRHQELDQIQIERILPRARLTPRPSPYVPDGRAASV